MLIVSLLLVAHIIFHLLSTLFLVLAMRLLANAS